MLPVPVSGDLATSIACMVKWAVGDEVAVVSREPHQRADIQLCVGPDVQPADDVTSIYAVANGWKAWVGDRDLCAAGWQGHSANPLGPYMAACLLAGEVFKRARGISRGRWIHDLGYSLWTGQQGPWETLADGPELAGLGLPAMYVVGCGAVGQGLINIVGAARFGDTYVVSIDDDHHDRTNFNRCFLAGIDDFTKRKVNAVKRYRELAGIGGIEHFGTIKDYVTRGKPGLRADLMVCEADDRFDCVISCVDKGTSRQDIQGLWPRVIYGGSTLGMGAKTNIYDLVGGTACLGCHNPPEPDGDELRKVERLVRGMNEAERHTYFESAEHRKKILAYLAGAERCGALGEAQFRKFVTDRAREFSVSFVSMAAATLLASRLFARLLFGGQEPLRAPMTSTAFLNGSFDDDRIAVDPFCRRCHGDPRAAWHVNSPFG